MTLAVVHSEEEMDQLLEVPGITMYWLGARDQDSEGNWAWVDNSDFVFDNWKNGEPNGGTRENCMRTYHGGEWNDEGCSNKWPYACMTVPEHSNSESEVESSWSESEDSDHE